MDLAPGTVTVADLYRELVGMRADVSKALTEITVITERNKSFDTATADHEARIRVLEKFRWTLGGLALAGGALAGYLGYVLGNIHH